MLLTASLAVSDEWQTRMTPGCVLQSFRCHFSGQSKREMIQHTSLLLCVARMMPERVMRCASDPFSAGNNDNSSTVTISRRCRRHRQLLEKLNKEKKRNEFCWTNDEWGNVNEDLFFFSLVRCVVLFVQSSSMRATLHAAEFVKLNSTCWIDNGNDDVCNSYKVNQFHGSDSDFFRLLCHECRMHGVFLVHTHTQQVSTDANHYLSKHNEVYAVYHVICQRQQMDLFIYFLRRSFFSHFPFCSSLCLFLWFVPVCGCVALLLILQLNSAISFLISITLSYINISDRSLYLSPVVWLTENKPSSSLLPLHALPAVGTTPMIIICLFLYHLQHQTHASGNIIRTLLFLGL